MLRINQEDAASQLNRPVLLVKEQSAQNLIFDVNECGDIEPPQVRDAFAATIFCISATNRF